MILAGEGSKVTPLAGDQSKVYIEGTIAKRWNPVGQQPLIADGARGKAAENIYGALHLGTGEEVVPFVIDWQDSDATICWLEQVLETCPRGKIVLWIDQAPHHTSEEVEEWLEAHRRLRVIHFPAYTPEENPSVAADWLFLYKRQLIAHRADGVAVSETADPDQDWRQIRNSTVANFVATPSSSSHIFIHPETT